ncbi:hypothetical protein D3C87_1539540 [compost metagenome]
MNSALVSGGVIVSMYSAVYCWMRCAISSAAFRPYSKKYSTIRISCRLTSKVECVLINAYSGRYSLSSLISLHNSRL